MHTTLARSLAAIALVGTLGLSTGSASAHDDHPGDDSAAVWLFGTNPDGQLAGWNPRVSCR